MAKTARRRPTPAIKLSRWKWVGKGPQDRPLSGEMIGRSKAEVAAELTKQNIVIRRISKKGNLGGSGRINPNDVMVFARHGRPCSAYDERCVVGF